MAARQHEDTVVDRPPSKLLPDPKNLINDIIALAFPKCQTSPGELTRQEWRGVAAERQAESALSLGLSLAELKRTRNDVFENICLFLVSF